MVHDRPDTTERYVSEVAMSTSTSYMWGSCVLVDNHGTTKHSCWMFGAP